MDEGNGTTGRSYHVPDADIDVLMAQIRSRVHRAQTPAPDSAVASNGQADSEQAHPAGGGSGAGDMQTEFNTVVTQTLATIMEQIQQVQRSLVALGGGSTALSPAVANGEARYAARAMDIVDALTVPYMAQTTNGASASNGHHNGV